MTRVTEANDLNGTTSGCPPPSWRQNYRTTVHTQQTNHHCGRQRAAFWIRVAEMARNRTSTDQNKSLFLLHFCVRNVACLRIMTLVQDPSAANRTHRIAPHLGAPERLIVEGRRVDRFRVHILRERDKRGLPSVSASSHLVPRAASIEISACPATADHRRGGRGRRPPACEDFEMPCNLPLAAQRAVGHTDPRRRRGRVAEGGGLLNRYRVVKPYRGFESLRLRQPFTHTPICDPMHRGATESRRRH